MNYDNDGDTIYSSDSGEIPYDSIVYDPALDCFSNFNDMTQSTISQDEVPLVELTQPPFETQDMQNDTQDEMPFETQDMQNDTQDAPPFDTQDMQNETIDDNIEMQITTQVESSAPQPPPLTTTSYYVVSDRYGFIAAFSSELLLRYEMGKYYLIPYIIQKFEANQKFPLDSIWVVLYRDIDAVAFVSNDRDEAVKFQKLYNSVGLSYEDDIDYWKQQVNVVMPLALERLKQISEAHKKYIPSDIPYLDSFNKMTDESDLNIFEYVKAEAETEVAKVENEENGILC